MSRILVQGPLRKITGYHSDQFGRIIEALECGHEQRRKQDIYGETNAYRRRCRQCKKELEEKPDS